MGAFRAVLALTVVVYHSAGGLTLFGVHVGVAAVVGFFVISGYAMTGLIDRHFSGSGGAVPFYSERFVRLAPQYFGYLLLSALLIFGLGVRSSTFQGGSPTPFNLISHLTVVPLSAFSYFPEIARFQFIPQAWSLGTEVLFYALFPFLLVSKTRVYLGAAASLIVLFLALAGILDPDAFGYRMLPGTLIFFLAGHFIYRRNWHGLAGVMAALVLGGLLIKGLVGFDRGYNRSIFVGAVVGVAGVYLTKDLPRNAIDDLLGAAAYGCYLCHVGFIFLFQHYGWLGDRPVVLVVTLSMLSLVAGLGSYWLFERPTLALRRSYRVRNASQKGV